MFVDCDIIMLCWGDGFYEWILWFNGLDFNGDGVLDGEIIFGMDVKLSIYRFEYIYEEVGFYILSIIDFNWNGGIFNVNFLNFD